MENRILQLEILFFSSNDRELYNDVAFSANSDTGTVSDNTVE